MFPFPTSTRMIPRYSLLGTCHLSLLIGMIPLPTSGGMISCMVAGGIMIPCSTSGNCSCNFNRLFLMVHQEMLIFFLFFTRMISFPMGCGMIGRVIASCIMIPCPTDSNYNCLLFIFVTFGAILGALAATSPWCLTTSSRRG